MTEDIVIAGTPVNEDSMERLAEKIRDLSAGDCALLRRLYLVQSSSSRSYQADGVVVGLLHSAQISVPGDVGRYEVWRLTAHVAALLTGTGASPHSAHDRRRSLGKALATADYSENRLLRLTAARGPLLVDQIVRAARVLARSDQGQGGRPAVDLWTLFDLAGTRPAEAEAARLRIAKDYYTR